jgi:hypothetical protein
MAASEKLYQDALALPAETRVELTESLVASLADDVPAEIQRAHLDEIRKRIAQVESGEIELIPGKEAFGARTQRSDQTFRDGKIGNGRTHGTRALRRTIKKGGLETAPPCSKPVATISGSAG